MFVLSSWPLPKPHRLFARCQRGFCGGAWLIYGDDGRIRTQYADAFAAARHVHGHNLLAAQLTQEA